MTKGKIILISILAFLLLVVSVLFGFVFRLRKQTVAFIENEPRTSMTLNITKEQIISSSELKKGKSIFLLDKEKAIKNIETNHPFLKVVQIKTKSLTKVEIIVQERHKLLYTTYKNTNDGKTYYYVMDKDLKILRIEHEETELTKIENDYIYISNEYFDIDIETSLYDYLGDEYTQDIISKAYNEIYRYAVLDGIRLDYDGIRNMITEIGFDFGYTADGKSPHKRLILKTKIINTDPDKEVNITIDIANPNKDLGKKINTCFASLDVYEDKETITTGRIAYYLTQDGTGRYGYFAE